jgi:F-type H+-transporting ATPase subunit b
MTPCVWTLMAAEAHGPTLVGIELGMFFWTLLTFALLLVALRFTAWPKIVKALDEREKRIQQRFDDAEARVKAAEARVAEYEERLRHVEDESRRILDKSRQDAERIAVEIQSKGRAEVEKLVDRARREIGLAQAKAADDLKGASIDMVIQVVEQVLDRNIKDEEHRQFIEECINKYEKSAS